jgi:hypothetical protein
VVKFMLSQHQEKKKKNRGEKEGREEDIEIHM